VALIDSRLKIEQDADTVAFVYRDGSTSEHDPTGSNPIPFAAAFTRYVDMNIKQTHYVT
jgi:hypothetical protein